MITEELYIDKYILTEIDKQAIMALCCRTKNYQYICEILNKLEKLKEGEDKPMENKEIKKWEDGEYISRRALEKFIANYNASHDKGIDEDEIDSFIDSFENI